jgi:hypothetical protein
VSYPTDEPRPSGLHAFPPDLTFPGGHVAQLGRPPSRRPRAGFWLVVVLVVLAVLAMIGGAAYLTYRLVHQTAQAVHTAGQTKVVEPAKLGTLAKGKDAKVDELIAGLRERMPPEFTTETTSSVLAGYGTIEQRDVVVVLAFATLIPDPAPTLDELLHSMTSDSAVLVRIDPGPLGGFAKCSNDKTNGVPSAFCAWADSGSVGVLIFFGQPFDDKLKARFVAARSQIEQRTG